LDPWSRRLDPEEARGLATLDTAPELPLGSNDKVLIERIGVGGDLHPFAAAVITESTAVLAATTHILCCSCAVSFFEDRYENALIHLLKKKQAGEAITPVRGVPPESVVNLMDTRRASIDAEKKKSPAPSTEARQPKKRNRSKWVDW
jgi:hypothetical protein